MSLLKSLKNAVMSSGAAAALGVPQRTNPYSNGFLAAMMDAVNTSRVSVQKRKGFRDRFLPVFADHLKKIARWGGPPIIYAHPTCLSPAQNAELHQGRINAAHAKRARKNAKRLSDFASCADPMVRAA